ncbi:MAG: 30S ribosomal protein S6 [Bdellovibrionales bacterium]|nr:30S ribosomal protein S6 [Bdellovibrionales bacterium]
MSLQFYEVIVALSPSTEESKQKELFSQIQKVIKDFGGSLHHIDLLGTRALANTGKKKPFRRACYFHFAYQSNPEAVYEVNRLFRMRDFVLYSHHENLDNRISLDKHYDTFEKILKDSLEREEARQARLQIKRKKFESTREVASR